MTTPAVAARALKDFPELARHACVNDAGAAFGDVIACTPTPHLLEHVAITLQVRSARSERASFTGSTSYVERGAHVCTHIERKSITESAARWREACVELSFSDDLEALRAYKEALAYVNGLLMDAID